MKRRAHEIAVAGAWDRYIVGPLYKGAWRG